MIVQFMNHRVKYSVVCFSCVHSSSSTVGSLGSRTLIGARWCGRSRRAWRSLSHSSRYRAHVQGSFTVPWWCVMAEGVVSRPFLLWFVVHRNPPPKSLKTRTGPLSLKMWVPPTLHTICWSRMSRWFRKICYGDLWPMSVLGLQPKVSTMYRLKCN